jgi:hypothetical protein
MNWLTARSLATGIGTLLFIVVAIVGGGCASSSDNSSTNGDQGSPTENATAIKGKWNAECNQFSGGDQDACKAIRVSKVTCQWEGDKVHVIVVMHNTFDAHVTVHMNPIYKLKNAGLHGDGISAVHDIGLDPDETRTYDAEEEPAGVSGQPEITDCRPGVDTLLGVELG